MCPMQSSIQSVRMSMATCSRTNIKKLTSFRCYLLLKTGSKESLPPLLPEPVLLHKQPLHVQWQSVQQTQRCRCSCREKIIRLPNNSCPLSVQN